MIESHPPSTPTEPTSRVQPVRLPTIADLLREAYGSKRKRLAPSKADLKSMQSTPKLEPEQREHMLQLAASDRTLERSRELLLLSVEKLAHHPVDGQLRDFLREVLKRHPAYRDPSLSGVLENLPDAVSVDTAVATVSAQSFDRLPWPEGTPPLMKGQVEALQLAAVHCLLLWMRVTRGLSTERIQGLLQSACWARPQRRHESDGRILRTLILARDRVALGIACSLLETKARENARIADAAREAEERARAIGDRLKGSLDEANAQMERERSLNRELLERIEQERREHENEKAHMQNEYEDLRGRIHHRLRQEVILLDEGLTALKRQPPKVHVMEDHAERVIDALKSEIERVRRGFE